MTDFTGYSKAPRSAADFDDLCSALFDAAKSVASCRLNELVAEANHLRDARNVLAYAKLSRKNPRLEERRRKALSYANEVMARRSPDANAT